MYSIWFGDYCLTIQVMSLANSFWLVVNKQKLARQMLNFSSNILSSPVVGCLPTLVWKSHFSVRLFPVVKSYETKEAFRARIQPAQKKCDY